jgi:hypothetical protein
LPDGKFTFEGVEPGTYFLDAGKSKYSKGSAEFTIDKGNLEITKNVYIYSQTVSPGLYQPIEGAEAEKITNDWAIWQPTCKASGFVLRSKFTNKKEKKDMKLPDPRNVPINITSLYKIATSASSLIDVTSYPVKNSPAKKHSDCSDVEAKETLLIPDMEKGNKLETSYKSENLYEIKGKLLSGKQFLAINQDGKLVGLYYLNAQ